MPFADDFTWGVASAAFQIEGSPEGDGRGRSIWDAFCDTPGKIANADHARVACDSYQRLDEDLQLLDTLGVGGYRFSISWPRLFPLGVGEQNEQGFAYYDRLIDGLLERGIEPWVTLFHWDMPRALYERGGWLSPDSPRWFEDYTRAVVERYSDRVSHWFTLNEPAVFLGHGHRIGEHAPGLQLPRRDVLLATHHVLLAHGRAVRTIREHCKRPATVGFAPVGVLAMPESEGDVETARRETFAVTEGNWSFSYSWYCDPVLRGHYPEDGLALFGDDAPPHSSADLELMHQPLDVFGVNIYSGHTVRTTPDGTAEHLPPPQGHPMTVFRWPVTPDSLYWGPRLLHERYGLPIVITENGLASMDWVHADGRVHDAGRIDFLTRYLSSLRRAADDGVDVSGYFHWSILDNFEWAEGYRMRFGLVYMDYQTMRRIPKDSFDWYANVIRTNGTSLPTDPAPLA